MQTLIKKRDYKGLYKNAIRGKTKNVVGIDIKFKLPKKPDLIIKNDGSKKQLYKFYPEIINRIKKKNKTVLVTI